MKYLNLLLLFCSLSIVFCSCTVTKRHFGNGYHVEWKHKTQAVISDQDIAKVELTQVYSEPERITENPDSLNSNRVICEVKSEADPESLPTQLKTKKKTAIQSVKKEQEPERIKPTEKTVDEDPENSEIVKQRMHPLNWGIWGSWTVALISILLIFGGLEVFGVIGFAVGLFIAMIFGIIVIVSLRMHPEKYKYKGLSYGFAIPAIVMGGIVFLLAILYFLSAFVSF